MTELIGSVLILLGAIFLFSAGLGLLRMPDAYTRLQACTKASTLGNMLVMAGLAVYHPGWTLKLIMIVYFVLMTNPISSHAIARADTFDDAIFLEATAAKIRSAEAAPEVAAIAHQVHGALGFTSEHILHRYTLRMLAWRDDFGNESHWAAALGNKVAALGAEEFWPLVAAR